LEEARRRPMRYLPGQEAGVLIAVLEDLMRRGITGLGLHDGLLVPQPRAEEALCSMDATAKQVTGISIPARLEE
jgi:hypothetical protein